MKRSEPAWIEDEKSPRGGWTKATLAAHGIPWPPPKGWRRRLGAPVRKRQPTDDRSDYIDGILAAWDAAHPEE